ncbi:rhomboid family intramembrane serine protease [Nonomuraea phyllanthi]|uniref:Rhomboid family intramembrane serine protease n=1 Tax=Nonomuraea phyllanthi TaxID=2219224 RepID=A0A5C4WF83_9ACTN|nr:rhomboid family intramembrane serine protease [Nonomuraea phyllanthi]KAB8193707.1 rhomboid family intramembrane serine protease [Nonomuraea phyllanthi]
MFKPYATATAFAVTAVPSLLQFALPGLQPALMRDPAAIRGGEWWRLGTALVVQDGGLLGTLFNLAFLAVLGYLAERSFGPARWLALYAAGAVTGEAAGYLLDDQGAGNSIALCGLAAGLALAAEERTARSLGAFYAIVSGVWLLAALGTWGVVAMVAVAAAGFQLVAQRERVPAALFTAVPIAVAAVLVALRDLHGFALVGGMIVAWILRGTSPSTSRSTRPA